jgi:ABC-2 type transport system ATP-binding protein
MTWGLDSVRVIFGETTALDDVSLEARPGEVAVVVGGDGAGKTTLSRTLVGLEPIASGTVHRPGRTGFQPESSGVWNDLTVMENLDFVAGAYGIERGRARSRIDQLLEVTGLGPATDRLGRQLSGGMRQKLGVAMAVLSDPELLVLDEPTTGLDPLSRVELWSFITLSAREGRAVVLTTAYVDEASRAGSVLALDDGVVLASGTVNDVLSAMPGVVYDSDKPGGSHSWRRGRAWRVWSPDGMLPAGAASTSADLADVVTVAALAREAGR